MSVDILPTPSQLSSASSWQTVVKPTSLTSYVVGNHLWLGRFLSVVHFARKLWHWQRQANEIYHYFKNPLLAIGDLTAGQLSENKQFLQTAFLITEVISSGIQAEEARSAMVNTWEEILDQMRYPREVHYCSPTIHHPKSIFYNLFLKLKEFFRLIGHLFIHSYTFSMHVMDITDLIWDPKARKRANRRFATNIHKIYQQSQMKLNELMLTYKLQPLPFFKYLGIKPQQLEWVASLRSKAIFVTDRLKPLTDQIKPLTDELTAIHAKLRDVESGVLSNLPR